MNTNQNIFLTGKAGTGKTTFLRQIQTNNNKKTVVVAPTGVAAINAGGVTMHSFFHLPFKPFLPQQKRGFGLSFSEGVDLNTLLHNARFNKERRKIFEELELLIIDEVSMLRADMLDAIDGILRHYRKKNHLPFGGVQILLIGDLYQLPPVVKDDEWQVLQPFYKSLFFFDATVMQQTNLISIELDKIYRQSDEVFINLLNKIRNSNVDESDLSVLNKYYDQYFYPEIEDGYIVLTSHNFKADKINQAALAKLNNELYEFEGELKGEFNESALPVDKKLVLKVGAQIMFIRNDKGENRRYYNGKIGIVTKMRGDEVYVKFLDGSGEMKLEKEVWRNVKYKYSEQEDRIEEEEIGSYKQYPIRLAWAVTIHKSQGLTFDKAIIDAGQSFAAGQVYVALSRLTSLQGLVLSSPIGLSAIQTEEKIRSFSQHVWSKAELRNALIKGQKEYLITLLLQAFNWEKLIFHFQDYLAQISLKLNPSIGSETLLWVNTMIERLTKLSEVGNKFSNQLLQLVGDVNSYTIVQQRVLAAHVYFQKEIENQLIQKWQEHFNFVQAKSKVKKHLTQLQFLYEQIDKKIIEIEQVNILAKGLAAGEQLDQVFQEFHQTLLTKSESKLSVQTVEAIKENTKEISLRLFQQGKSIADIAIERGLTQGTIEGHLLGFVETGKVEFETVIANEIVLKIEQAFANSEEKTVVAVRRLLNNAYSYSVISAVITRKLKTPSNT